MFLSPLLGLPFACVVAFFLCADLLPGLALPCLASPCIAFAFLCCRATEHRAFGTQSGKNLSIVCKEAKDGKLRRFGCCKSLGTLFGFEVPTSTWHSSDPQSTVCTTSPCHTSTLYDCNLYGIYHRYTAQCVKGKCRVTEKRPAMSHVVRIPGLGIMPSEQSTAWVINPMSLLTQHHQHHRHHHHPRRQSPLEHAFDRCPITHSNGITGETSCENLF
ncbi:hypothetical protein V8C26DRAFT_242048 [Trichoderma gracile]